MNLSLLLYFGTVLNICAFAKRRKIIGGQNANLEDFSHQAALVFPSTEKFLCGACIISNWYILTAAHCLYKGNKYYKILRIYTGISNIKDGTPSKYKIKAVHIHPEYTGETSEVSMSIHDIAIVAVKGSIVFNEFQNKIKVRSTNYRPGDKAMISGWGMTHYPSANKSNILQKASVNVLSNSECSEYFEFPIRSDQLCTLQHEGIGVCNGDSGGPVTLNGELIGIISFNAPCAKGVPDVHTNVYSYLNFIRSYVDDM